MDTFIVRRETWSRYEDPGEEDIRQSMATVACVITILWVIQTKCYSFDSRRQYLARLDYSLRYRRRVTACIAGHCGAGRHSRDRSVQPQWCTVQQT